MPPPLYSHSQRASRRLSRMLHDVRDYAIAPLSQPRSVKAGEPLCRGCGIPCFSIHEKQGQRFTLTVHFNEYQYQKQPRLLSARGLMLNNGLDAASAALEVGYESCTQFNREYSRLFGQPPMRDIRALRSPEAPKLESVGNL
jgi:AraC-like DNA-binding protein